MNKNIFRVASSVVLLCLAALTSYAQQGHKPVKYDHSAYIHALYNLRSAHWMLEHRPGNWQRADEEIEAAIQIEALLAEIKRANINDGKTMEQDPPVDDYPDHVSHIKAAYNFLRKAREDIDHTEDDPYTKILHASAYTHIDEAIRNIDIAGHIFTSDKPLLAPVNWWSSPLPTALEDVQYFYH